MRRLKIIIPFLLFVVYLSFSAISLTESTKIGGDDFFEIITAKKQKTKESIFTETNSVLFNCKLIDQLLIRNVVLDTTLIGIVYKKNEYFIKASVNTNCSSKVYAELKCNQDILKDYNKTKSNSLYIAARVNSYISSFVEAEFDTIDGKEISIDLGEHTLLIGECIAFLEKPGISSI